MAMFDFVINDQSVGQSVGPASGYLVSLRMTQGPPVYQTPEGDDGRGVWTRSYLQLRGSGDLRDLYCACPAQGGVAGNVLVQSQSLRYHGDLTIVACPRGSAFSLTLSDVPNVRTPTSWAAVSMPPPPREVELVMR